MPGDPKHEECVGNMVQSYFGIFGHNCGSPGIILKFLNLRNNLYITVHTAVQFFTKLERYIRNPKIVKPDF